MGLCPDALVAYAIFHFFFQSWVAVTLLTNSRPHLWRNPLLEGVSKMTDCLGFCLLA